MGEAVAGGASLDDGGVVGEPVDDRGAQAGVGEGFGPAAEGFVGRDRDGGLLFAFGEDLEQEFGAAPVESEVTWSVPEKMEAWFSCREFVDVSVS